MATGRDHAELDGTDRPQKPHRTRDPDAGSDRRTVPGSVGQVLGLQRQAGNRATARMFATAPQRDGGPALHGDLATGSGAARSTSAPVAPAQRMSEPVIQRSMYLANYDDRIYQDTNNAGVQYAYVTKSGNTLVFADYDGIDRLRAAAAGAFAGVDPVSSDFDTRLRDTYRAGGVTWDGLWGALGGFFTYDSRAGTVAPLAVDDLGRAVPGLLAMAIRTGPRLWSNSGGSRLPRAEGHLLTHGMSQEQAMGILGYDDDASGVNIVKIDQAERYGAMESKILNDKAHNAFPYRGANPDAKMLYVSTAATARSAAHRIRVANQRFSDTEFFSPAMPVATSMRLQADFGTFTPPRSDSGWVPGTNLTAVDRGAGQDTAMSNWNALGLAAYGNRFLGHSFDLQQNWEWLHIQGAQIGGVTDATNLIAGTYVTNSAMIPFESMIAKWAQAGPTQFWARFQIVPGNTLFPQRVRLSIRADGHSVLGTLAEQMLVEVDPLRGNIVDKLANEVIKRNIDARVGVHEIA